MLPSPGSLIIKTNAGKEFDSNGLLFATGREPFLDGLKLEQAGIEILENKIKVDSEGKTNISNIFAIGDVTDRINLTPVAIDEGRSFADRNYGKSNRKVNYELVPYAVFSQPEIASGWLQSNWQGRWRAHHPPVAQRGLPTLLWP